MLGYQVQLLKIWYREINNNIFIYMKPLPDWTPIGKTGNQLLQVNSKAPQKNPTIIGQRFRFLIKRAYVFMKTIIEDSLSRIFIEKVSKWTRYDYVESVFYIFRPALKDEKNNIM